MTATEHANYLASLVNSKGEFIVEDELKVKVSMTIVSEDALAYNLFKELVNAKVSKQ